MASNSETMTVTTMKDLNRLRDATGLESVQIFTKLLKYRRGIKLALKWGLFALKPGGSIEIIDEADSLPYVRPYEVNFALIRSWAFRLLGRDTTLEHIDVTAGLLRLRRTRPNSPQGWSAGVMFSGQPSEAPMLRCCLAGLESQPELKLENGGQIVVCGPESARNVIADRPWIEYLTYDHEPGPRFLIGEKKNTLASALRNPRIAIMHARIVLEKGALANVPQEFDVATPDVFVERKGKLYRYLSMGISDVFEIDKTPVLPLLGYGDLRRPDPITLHRVATPYIDGGIFFAMKHIYDACPLNTHLAWGEVEDGEWCSRLAAQGYLVELFPKSIALSQSDKVALRPQLPWGIDYLAMSAFRFARFQARALQHYSSCFLGRR